MSKNLILPKKGHWYFCYDDGKVNTSRIAKLKVLDVIPFDKASKALLKAWGREFKGVYTPLRDTTPCFIRTKVLGDTEPPVYFALMRNEDAFYSFQRPGNSYWFSNYMLDVDGKLTKGLVRWLRKDWTEKDYQAYPDAKAEHEEVYKDYAEWKKQIK